jgi:hypothetical protein
MAEKKGRFKGAAILQVGSYSNGLIFQKYPDSADFFSGVDMVSCAEKSPLPGLANGGFYGPGIVLVFPGSWYGRGPDP